MTLSSTLLLFQLHSHWDISHCMAQKQSQIFLNFCSAHLDMSTNTESSQTCGAYAYGNPPASGEKISMEAVNLWLLSVLSKPHFFKGLKLLCVWICMITFALKGRAVCSNKGYVHAAGKCDTNLKHISRRWEGSFLLQLRAETKSIHAFSSPASSFSGQTRQFDTFSPIENFVLP